MRAVEDDEVVLSCVPGGTETPTVLEVRYERISVEPFHVPPRSEVAAERVSPDKRAYRQQLSWVSRRMGNNQFHKFPDCYQLKQREGA